MQEIKNPVNLRDLGGIKCRDGKVIEPKRLLRSGEPVNLSEDEKHILLNDYHLRCIVDFRSEREVRRSPDDIFLDVYYINLDLIGDHADEAASLENMEDHLEASKMETFMKRVYADFITLRGARIGYRHFIDVLLEQEKGAVLFHCFAGKDRTGMAAAIILTLLGASKEDILTDYLKTNEQRKEANSALIEQLKKQGLHQTQLEAFDIGLSVDQSYLELTYALAEKHYGSFLGYIKEGLAVSDDEIEKLQRMYLR